MFCSVQPNILSNDELEFILGLSEVQNAKHRIDSMNAGSVYFSIFLTQELKNVLKDFLGRDNLDDFATIPMRWIKGDTKPHMDIGVKSFENTYLAYITDSEGEIRIEDKYYPITKGSGYIFEEGLIHETINTGDHPRLLLGPMNNAGFAVGAPQGLYGPGGSTIYIRQNGSDIEYSNDNNFWNTIYWPTTVINTDVDSGFLKIEFITDISLNSSNQYFECDPFSRNGYIQFGSTSLKQDGSRPIITIDGISDYPGFINNGSLYNNGNSNVYLFNLDVRIINDSSLYSNGYDAAGWVGHAYFGKGATHNYIINCISDGPIINQYCGGILGSKSGSELGADLHLIGCSSSGELGSHCGGIIGYHAGINSGIVVCESCWTTGNQISTYAGGIFGDSSGIGSGSSISAFNCYSTGTIGVGGGGICGGSCGRESGSAMISACYSTGLIGAQGGGIVGIIPLNTTVDNCYTTGNTNSETAGCICGEFGFEESILIQNCYTSGVIINNKGYIIGNSSGIPATCFAEGNGTWTTSNANTVLQGLPSPVVGSYWVATQDNQPYELRIMGYSPYSINNIIIEDAPYLRDLYSYTISPGDYTPPAIISYKNYKILQIDGGESESYSSISINELQGLIRTIPGNTADGIYDIYIRNDGSYHISIYRLTVTYIPPAIPFAYQKAMPIKDITSDGTSTFSTSRRAYMRMLQPDTATSLNNVNPTKKWVGGSRDASQATTHRRIATIGNGSLNANGAQMSFMTMRDVNTVNDARNRVRAGGSTVPAKTRFRII
jgi:hypothetical protein